MKRGGSFGPIGSFTESSRILGTQLGYEAILRMIPHLDLRNSLVLLAKILWALDEMKMDFMQLQLEISNILLERYLSKIRSILSGNSSVIFFQPQILSLMKLILINSLHRNEMLGRVTTDQRNKIGLSLLGIADEISRQAKRSSRNLAGENLAEEVAKELILMGFHVKNLRTGASLIRATHLYVNLSNEFMGSEEIDYIDLDKTFRDAVGVGIREYLSFGVAFIVNFLRISSDEKFPEDFDFIYVRPNEWFKNSIVSKEDINKIILLLSDDTESFRARLENETKREILYDFMEFKTTPLLKLEEGWFIPLSLPFYMKKLLLAFIGSFLII